MKQVAQLLILTGLFFLWPGAHPAVSAVYQWTTPDGVLGLTDDPGRIPEAYRNTAKLYGGREETPKVERLGGSITPPSAQTPSEGPPSETSIRRNTDYQGHDREWWQARIQSLKAEQENIKKQRQVAEDRLNQLHYFGTDTLKELEEERILRNQIEELSQTLTALHQQLREDLPTEARKTGAPPGWLRE